MKKGKLNIPTKSLTASAAAVSANAPNASANPLTGNAGRIHPSNTSPAPNTTNKQAKTDNRPSVMIAVPAMEMVNAEFAQHLAMAAANMVAHGIKINCAFNIGSVITIARRNLVDIFMKTDFTHIWWVDSDMKFPIDAPIRLLQRNKPIVGANYRRRRFPNPNFTGMKGTAGNFTEFVTNDQSPDMELIDVLPHGMVMVQREVYERVPQPHYLQEYVPHLNLEIGEDIFFCQQCQKAGYEIWCDQTLSKEVSHIGIFHFNYNLSVPR